MPHSDTAACRFAERSHFQALGRDIVASICHCCSIVVLCTQDCARRTNYHAQPVASCWTGWACLDTHWSDQCAREGAAGAARQWASLSRTLVLPVCMVKYNPYCCYRPHAVAIVFFRYLEGQYLSYEKPMTVPFPWLRLAEGLHFSILLSLTPVAASIFGPLSQTHISKRVFMNEISSSASIDIQLILFCVCGVDSFLPELEHL